MDTYELFGRLGLSLGIGLLFGIERGWKEREGGDGSRTAGIRTFTLIGFLGGVWATMTPTLGPVPLAAAASAVGVIFAAFYWRETASRNEFSMTSVVVALLAFALGAFAVLGSEAAAGAGAVVAVGVLAARQRMHAFVAALTWPELRAGVLLLAMTFVALPILPNRAIDPWGTFNPHELWLMTVLIAVVSFVGYVAVRVMGETKGFLLSSAAGALISSTTVTINSSRLAKGRDEPRRQILSAAICFAWIVSLLRMTAVAASANIFMLQPLALPIISAVAVLGVGLFYFMRHSAHETEKGDVFENPLDWPFVLKFGALLTVVTIAANLAGRYFGQEGVLGLAGISGFVDVDPITLAVSRSSAETMMYREAVRAICLAASANMVTKMAATIFLGGWRFGFKLVIAGLLALAVGAGSLFISGG